MSYTQKLKRFISILLATGAVVGGFWYATQRNNHDDGAYFETIWGEHCEYDDTILTVLHSDVMIRLKRIDQSGPSRYFGPHIPPFSRYDHSVGVWALLKKAGVPVKEQVIGALHDVSHTTFSHVGDYIFAKDVNDYVQTSYHDLNQLKFQYIGNVHAVLRKVGLSNEDFDIDAKKYPCLEQPSPELCADRIQYNNHTAVIMNRISQEEARAISDDMHYENGKWYFTDAAIAEKFAEIPLYFTMNFWGAKWNTEMNIHMAQALKRAIELNEITLKELYDTDDAIMKKLCKIRDHVVIANLQQCKNPLVKIKNHKYVKRFFKPKFRGVDPWVKGKDGILVRLSGISVIFKNYYEAVKKWCADGFEMDILAE
jgi:HD superfamily phosphohydrolase